MKTFKHLPLQFTELETITTKGGQRYYRTPDGVSYPSVTTILSEHSKKGIADWRKRIGAEAADKISRQAATRGTKFHAMAEKYLNNEYKQEKMNLLDMELFEMAVPELEKIDNIRAQEVPLYSHHLRLAGRVDCIGEYDGKLSIIDFKTARREKDPDHVQHYFMQACAYSIMFEELTGTPINRLTLIIAVEDGFMQILQSRRDKHVQDLLHYRDLYEKTQGEKL
jgi:ATP-dependent exoDNAse (exonuclease V) beta subunit